MSFTIDYDDIVETQFQNCPNRDFWPGRCQQYYTNNKNAIDHVLQKYDEYLPVVFVSDMPELGILYADIINHECFECICRDCTWPIVQLYNMTSENFLKKISTKTKESLCYN